MGVTRKERLLKAMLEDNASACGGGVSREERMLAGVAKKVCDNDALDGGGGGGVVWIGNNDSMTCVYDPETKTFGAQLTRAEFVNMFNSGITMLYSDRLTIPGHDVNTTTGNANAGYVIGYMFSGNTSALSYSLGASVSTNTLYLA